MKSSYYYGVKPKLISLDTIKTKALIRQIFNNSKHSAGARSIAAILMNDHNIKLTRYMIGKLMKSMSLKSCQLKTHKYKHCDEAHKNHNNILNRNFSPSAPNQVWTGDVTYVRIKGGWCYLAVVLDLYARHIVSFAVSDSPDSMLQPKRCRWRIRRAYSQLECCFTLIRETITPVRHSLNPWSVVMV